MKSVRIDMNMYINAMIKSKDIVYINSVSSNTMYLRFRTTFLNDSIRHNTKRVNSAEMLFIILYIIDCINHHEDMKVPEIECSVGAVFV